MQSPCYEFVGIVAHISKLERVLALVLSNTKGVVCAEHVLCTYECNRRLVGSSIFGDLLRRISGAGVYLSIFLQAHSAIDSFGWSLCRNKCSFDFTLL